MRPDTDDIEKKLHDTEDKELCRIMRDYPDGSDNLEIRRRAMGARFVLSDRYHDSFLQEIPLDLIGAPIAEDCWLESFFHFQIQTESEDVLQTIRAKSADVLAEYRQVLVESLPSSVRNFDFRSLSDVPTMMLKLPNGLRLSASQLTAWKYLTTPQEFSFSQSAIEKIRTKLFEQKSDAVLDHLKRFAEREQNGFAINTISDRHYDRVFRACLRITKSHDWAEDASQIGFMKYLKQTHYECEGATVEKLGPYLSKISINTIWDQHRKTKRHREVSLDSAGSIVDEYPCQVDQITNKDFLQHYFTSCGADEQIVLSMWWTGHSLEETADALGKTVDAVKNLRRKVKNPRQKRLE